MKFTREQRLAIIKRVINRANDEYKKRLNETKSKYVPSNDYKTLEKALHDREEACNIIRNYQGYDSYALSKIDISSTLNSFMEKELNIKAPTINKEDLETEILLSECSGVDELISHLFELVSKNNNN